MSYNTIKLRKHSDCIEELVAAGTITPGMLLEVTSAGRVQAHSGLGEEVAPIIFALEDELQGRSIDDDYSALEPVQVWAPYRGDSVYALLADNQNVSIGDKLKSAGDGSLMKYSAGDSDATGHQASIVAVAREAVNTVGSPASTMSRIKITVV